MSADVAKRTAEFIADNSHGEDVFITWYGGEPLMNVSAIDTVTSILKEKGIAFKSQIATNGSLFTDALIKKAVSVWNTDKVQITLDGTEEVYERIKAYTDRAHAFSTVLENIDALLLRGVKVNIRINLDGHNADDASELVRVLAARFGARQGLNVYTALLFDNCKCAKRPNSQYDRVALAKKAIEIEDLAASLGILRPRRLNYAISHSFCKADSESAIVILADGNLTKCDFYTDSHFVGSVYSGIDANLAKEQTIAFAKRTECKGCIAYPICLRSAACPTGGCDTARRLVTEERLVRSVRHLYSSLKEKQNV
ncbi:MAG: radical SAM protein, partial [Clostridia bacterium]|nr:radical SAM protein [Clostridia bacterium]